MPETVEQKIIDSLLTHLKAISKEAGYSFDICDEVYEWIDTPVQVTKPVIEVRDYENSKDETDEDEHVLRVRVILYLNGNTSPRDIRAKQQDVLTAIGKMDTDPEITGSGFTSAFKDVRRGGDDFSAVTFEIEFRYPTYKWEI